MSWVTGMLFPGSFQLVSSFFSLNLKTLTTSHQWLSSDSPYQQEQRHLDTSPWSTPHQWVPPPKWQWQGRQNGNRNYNGLETLPCLELWYVFIHIFISFTDSYLHIDGDTYRMEMGTTTRSWQARLHIWWYTTTTTTTTTIKVTKYGPMATSNTPHHHHH